MPGVCARCQREVYFAEERLALGKVWHTFCFSCLNCRRLLDSCTVSTHRGELFCRNCYSRFFPTISRSSKESNASKEIKTIPRVTPAPTTISVNESNCCRCCCCCCCIEDHPIGEASSIDDKDYRSKKHRLRGGGEKKENSQSSTEGIDKNPIKIPSSPRPCPRLSVRRVSFYEERNTLDPYCDMQNDREIFLADRKTSKTIENCSKADILTIRSSDDVRRSNQDLHDEELVNYSETVGLTQTPRFDNTIVSEHNEDNIVDEDMQNCNHKNFQDSRNHIKDNDDTDNDDDRMRGGHGGNHFCRSRKLESCCANKSTSEECGCFSCQNPEDKVCSYRGIEARKRLLGSESCPPREFDPCQDDHKGAPCSRSVAACPPLCADRRGCCPPAGSRPVCRKAKRSCCSPCKGESQSCGGGGCCGSGCRGGCGKPGQICMPARPCSTPPCRPHPPFVGSPCAPPRTCPPPPVCCRPASRGGCCVAGGGSSYCRSTSPPCRTIHTGGCFFDDRTCCNIDGADSCCKSKVPPGCECLGGGLDCQRCGRKVYQAEMQIVSGVPYHNICFSCFCCRKPLEPLTYQENCGEIYCKQCYIRNFGPQGYGYGAGAGALQTPM